MAAEHGLSDESRTAKNAKAYATKAMKREKQLSNKEDKWQ